MPFIHYSLLFIKESDLSRSLVKIFVGFLVRELFMQIQWNRLLIPLDIGNSIRATPLPALRLPSVAIN